jgi:hypothetical protein
MPKQLYLLDSNNATSKSTLKYLDGPDYFNISYQFKFPIQKLKKITLKTAEIPLLMHQQRLENTSVNFNFTFSYSTYSNIYVKCELVPKSDRTLAQLISDLNATINAMLANHSVTNFITAGVNISLIQVSNIVSINQTSLGITNNCTSIIIDDTILASKILGFSNKVFTPATGNALKSTPQLNIDNLLYIKISNIPIANNNLLLPYTFKIQIPSSWTSSQTIFYNDPYEQQSIDFYSTSAFLDKLDIQIVDKYGYPISGYYNWTCTLLIESEDDNTNNKIEFLNIYN